MTMPAAGSNRVSQFDQVLIVHLDVGTETRRSASSLLIHIHDIQATDL